MNSVKIDWGNEEKSYIRMVYRGEISEAEFRQALETTAEMADTVKHQVDIIAIDQGLYFFSVKLFRIGYAHQPQNKNLRYGIFVGAPSYVQTFASIVTRVVPNPVFEQTFFFQTEEEAVAFLRSKTP